jgi:nicotinamidase-related amidase
MTLDAAGSALLLIDLQRRLVPAIHGGEQVVAHTNVLLRAAELLHVAVLTTEQYPDGLGATVPEPADRPGPTLVKTAFDASAAAGFAELMPPAPTAVPTGAEAHVCSTHPRFRDVQRLIK